jgi:hypothetical protein
MHGTIVVGGDAATLSTTPTATITGTATALTRTPTPTPTLVTPTTTSTPGGPAPEAVLTSPLDGSRVTARSPVVGSASGATLVSWSLDYRSVDDDTFMPLGSGTTPVNNATLAYFDPTLLFNGQYEIRLSALDTALRSVVATVVVVVEGRQKIGNFSLSFTDLRVPVAGLPIEVLRTYDTRNKRQGDFGFGWTLGLRDVRLAENRVLGTAWEGVRQPGFLPVFCVQPTKPHIVSIALPDGTLHTFEPVFGNGCDTLAPPSFVTLGFRPLFGTQSVLAPLDKLDAIVVGPFPGTVQLLDPDTFEPVDPDAYQLTLQDGRALVMRMATHSRYRAQRTSTISKIGQ